MGSTFFIARRYLFSKKSRNVINIISGVAVFGIAISTAALIILLSAFNGIENLVITLFSTFEPDIKIEAVESKTFDPSFIPDEVYQVDGVVDYTQVLEEIVIIKNEEMFVIGSVKGVEESFLEMSEMDEHLLDGENTIYLGDVPVGLVGFGILESVGGYIFQSDFPPENFTIYSPNRNEKISRRNVDAFTTSTIPIVGTFSFNNEVDETYLVVPIEYAREILNYKNEVSAIEMKFEEGYDLEEVKEELMAIIGPSFKVKTNYEQNELTYQTSKSEKLITTLLLAFIFFLATFNMIASITMLVIEKKKDMQTLFSLGARKNQLERIFFYEGLMINGLGLAIGLILGYGICLLQQYVGLIRMEGNVVEYFPIVFKLDDLLVILGITAIFGVMAAYLPSKFLIKRILK
ncbi:FtsX-like permease family protein [Paracrocinitomix mangrovi]|uniref:FtsX-like permease family protein n=1 Tax=Paracrocinitomix mangrovi TaxID=2862509 RepID=UPI001C8EF73F|nr:FtsX-like permease family protein [Paracrocinitomix mangrovi]UKN03364.1 FtsX-like permease family protein [Paracrocinitomix mangrovi]